MCYVLFVNESMSLQIRTCNLYQKVRNTFFNSGRHHLWQIVALGCFIRIPRTFTQVRAFCGGDSPRSEAAESAGELELRLEDLRLRWTARARLCLQWEDSERGFYLQCLARTHAHGPGKHNDYIWLQRKRYCVYEIAFFHREVWVAKGSRALLQQIFKGWNQQKDLYLLVWLDFFWKNRS